MKQTLSLLHVQSVAGTVVYEHVTYLWNCSTLAWHPSPEKKYGIWMSASSRITKEMPHLLSMSFAILCHPSNRAEDELYRCLVFFVDSGDADRDITANRHPKRKADAAEAATIVLPVHLHPQQQWVCEPSEQILQVLYAVNEA